MTNSLDGDLHPRIASRVVDESLPSPAKLLAFHRLQSQVNAIGPVVAKPPSSSRSAVVKSGIVEASEKSSLGQKTGRHLNYLTRDGSGHDGEKAELFTKEEGQKVDPIDFRRQADRDTHQYHLVLSLADGNRVDMQRFTRDFMEQIEKDLQRSLSWVAAVHDDTGIRHAHIDIRGTDQKGASVAINTGHVQGTDEDGNRYVIKTHYLHNGMRYRAQQIATDYLGRVPAQDRAQEAERTTTLDTVTTRHAAEAQRAVEGEAMPTDRHISRPIATERAPHRQVQVNMPSLTAHDDALSTRITPDEKREMVAQMTPQAQAFLKSAAPHLFTNGHASTLSNTDELRTKFMQTTAELGAKLDALKAHTNGATKTPEKQAQEHGGGWGR